MSFRSSFGCGFWTVKPELDITSVVMEEVLEVEELVLLTPEEKAEQREARETRLRVRHEEKEKKRVTAQKFGRARREAKLAEQSGPLQQGVTRCAPEGSSASAITPKYGPYGKEKQI